MFSEVAFDREQVNSSCSPSSDFFVRSCLSHSQLTGGTPHPLLTPPITSSFSSEGDLTDVCKSDQSTDDLESAVLLRMTLVFLWKAYVVQESGQMKIVVGQHHVHVDRLNNCATSLPIPPTPPQRPPLRFVRDVEQDMTPDPSPEVTTRLVTYSLSHDHQREHPFSRGLCIVPVTVVLQNHSEREVSVVIDTSKTPESLSSGVQVTSTSDQGSGQPLPTTATSSHLVRWVGLTQATLTLSKGHNSVVSLKAGFTRPGTYNLNNLSVFVTYSSDQSQSILQKHITPSIITLIDSS